MSKIIDANHKYKRKDNFSDKDLSKLYNYWKRHTVNSDAEELISKSRDSRRLQQVVMNPYTSFKNKIIKNIDEKEFVLKKILDQIKEFKISKTKIEQINKEFGNNLLANCDICTKVYRDVSRYNNTTLSWTKYFEIVQSEFCSLDPECCKNIGRLRENKEFKTLYSKRRNMIYEHLNLEITYKVALEQQTNLIDSLENLINNYKENTAILIFKKNFVQKWVNFIQLSIIFVSALITLFETVKPLIKGNNTDEIIVLIPIALSTYIGFILAVGRFYKLDIKNEQIIKLIEKYSFIINKYIQKRDRISTFDFKLKSIKEWDDLLILEEKDNITDIVLKASEEKDIVLSPSEHIYYKKMYTRIFLKEKTETNNLNNLSFLIDNTHTQRSEVNKVVQKIIIKKPFLSYYLCCGFCFGPREEVDYDKIVLKDLADFDTVIQSQTNGDLILNYDQADSLDLKTSHIAKKQALEREKRQKRDAELRLKDRKQRQDEWKKGRVEELERTIIEYKEIMKNDFEKIRKLEAKILGPKIEIVPPNTQNIGLSITDLSNNVIDNSYTNETDRVEITVEDCNIDPSGNSL
tara:strand:+ start:587 stop:2317 length:1731 start_codon:yes stop_codon:yes gene_type:complete